ncbi:MAG: hypothetical protein L6Q66_05960 [Bacteroidia bacterium]|nr:hypothetical protein [Bacteroidia bacterium]
MSTKNEPSEQEQEFVRLFELITEKIHPAEKETANAFMSTQDFVDIISSHYPGAEFIQAMDVYRLLSDSGFKTEMIGGELVWMVKR